MKRSHPWNRALGVALCLLTSCSSLSSNPSFNKVASADLSSHLSPTLAVDQTQEQRERSEASGSRAIISTQGKAATQAAKSIFGRGGNIIDAAIAASFTIAVERPHSTGLAGGGFMMFREAKTSQVYAIDFRERAPLKSTAKMFLDEDGAVVPGLSIHGMLSVAVPGMVAGLIEIHEKFGKLPLAVVLQPAIRLAEKGLIVYPALAHAIEERKDELSKYPASRKIFLKRNGDVYRVGEILVQKDLGHTLRQIARQGRNIFYEGSIMRAIVAESDRRHGILSREDFANYRVKWRQPLHGTFKRYDIYSMPPPSSGGTHVLEILNILENDPLKELGFDSTQAIHRTASAMQIAFADRARFMGDPDFVKVPTEMLISKEYGQLRREGINAKRKAPSSEIMAVPSPNIGVTHESSDTTHFSIMDAEGNVVSSTQTINGFFGSSVVVPGTGMVLNNEMDDFSAKPGASNLFGAIGSEANSIAPGKTPLSSMSPTIVMKNGLPVLAVGAPGGTRIINCVAQTILNYLDYELPLYESVAAIRFHHQWIPDELRIDSPGPGSDVLSGLKNLGYKVELAPRAVSCVVMAVSREGSIFRGISDPRDAGTSAGMN